VNAAELLPCFARPEGFHHGCRPDDPAQHPHRPAPQPATGELKVDPEIRLRAGKFDLNVSFFYSSQSDSDQDYGRGRSASVAGHVLSATSGSIVTVVRGDFTQFPFKRWGESGGIVTFVAPSNRGVVTTLTFDGTKFVEHFQNGMEMHYQSQVGGTPVKHELTAVKDASGVAHSYTYGSGVEAGRLKTIEVPGARKVTFHYTPGGSVSLVKAVEDWSGRRWTMQYDAARYLTTLIEPTGCTTGYRYSLAGGPVTLLHAIEDPRGYLTTYMYDSDRHVVSMAAGTAVTTWSYDTANNRFVAISPSGARTTHHIAAGGVPVKQERPEGYVVTYTYHDNLIRLSERVPAGLRYSRTYDTTTWRVLVEEDGLGKLTTFQYL
jgi:YD repeat-containing protein